MHSNQIQPDMPVVCSEDGQFAEVDHMEGEDMIKIKKRRCRNSPLHSIELGNLGRKWKG